jgi:hypothetical protein
VKQTPKNNNPCKNREMAGDDCKMVQSALLWSVSPPA